MSSVNEEASRDLGDLEYLIHSQPDYEGASLVSDEDAVFRSIPMGGGGGPLDMDVSRGMDFEGYGPSKTLGDYSNLQDTFAKQRPDLMPHSKSATAAPTIFNVVDAASTPPSLSKDMCCVVSKTMVFCNASNINQITACVRNVVDEHYCFDRVAGKNEFADGPEDSEWVWNLTHYTSEKFSIDLNVTFWALDDMEVIAGAFRACPKNANFAIEFQRLGGDSFAWLDLWRDLLTGIMGCSQEPMQFTQNAEPVKRRCLDMDLLSDSEDDEGDDGDDLASSLVMLMDMCGRSGLEGQLEGLKTFCRMCENATQCKQMANNAKFRAYVVKVVVDISADCRKSSRPMPLLRCAVTLLTFLVGTPSGKDLVGVDAELMLEIAYILGDATCCQAVRYECAKLVLYMVGHGVDFAARETVLEAVATAVSVSAANGKRLNEKLAEVQSKVRSLSYR